MTLKKRIFTDKKIRFYLCFPRHQRSIIIKKNK